MSFIHPMSVVCARQPRTRFTHRTTILAAAFVFGSIFESSALADVYISSFSDSSIRRYSDNGTLIGGPITNGALAQATGIIANGTDLYISSLGFGSVLKYDTVANSFSVYGSLVSAGGLGSLAVDSSNNVFAGNVAGNNVFLFDGVSPVQSVDVIPGNLLGATGGLAFGPNGDLFVGDVGLVYAGASAPGNIYRVQNPMSATPTVTTFATAPVDFSGMATASGLYWHGNTLYASDILANGIWMYDANGQPTGFIPLPSVPANPDPGDTGYFDSQSPSTIVPDLEGTGFYVALAGPSQMHPAGGVGHYYWDGTPVGSGVFLSINQVISGAAVVPEPSGIVVAGIAGIAAMSISARRRRRPAQ